jgi:hypothetical protein
MLIYDSGHEMLHGTVGTTQFSFRAYSGGGRGSVNKPAGVATVSSWSFRIKEHGNVRGGPLPPGNYKCVYYSNHPKFHECISLNPIDVADLANRDGFFIHGRGPKGSDGCIVPAVKDDRLKLIASIKNHPGTVLRVVNPYFIPEGRVLPSNIA